MIRSTLTNIFRLRENSAIPAVEHQKSQALLVFNWLLFVLAILCLIWLASQIPLAQWVPLMLGTVLLHSAIFLSLKLERWRLARYLMVAYMLAVTGVFIHVEPTQPARLFALLAPALLISLLLERVGRVSVFMVIGLLLIVRSILILMVGTVETLIIVNELTIVFTTLLIAFIIDQLFNRGSMRQSETRQINQERFAVIFDPVYRATPNTSEKELLEQQIDMLRKAFNFDYGQVYVMEDGERLVRRLKPRLTAANRPEFDELPLGEAHPISEAARLQQAIQITVRDMPSRRQHFFPSIRHGVVVPVVVEKKVLVVVDLQRVGDVYLDADDMRLIEQLARQLGYDLQMVRQRVVLDAALAGEQQTISHLQSQLSTSQQQRQQAVNLVWNSYLEQRGQRVFGLDLQGGQFQTASEMPEAMWYTIQKGEEYITLEGDRKLISLPIMLRDEPLGAMTFAMPAGKVLSDRQLDLAKDIARRLSTSLENTSLLEQTVQQASRERRANEVASMLITATDIDSLLRLAADSFNEALGAVQTRIVLEPGIDEVDLTQNSASLSNGSHPPTDHSNGALD